MNWQERLSSYVRGDIEVAARQFFRRNVRLEDRVAQSMQVVTRRRGTPTSAHVWRALVEVTPALGAFYESIGYSPAMRPNPQPRNLQILDPSRDAFWNIAWGDVLRQCFAITSKHGDEMTASFQRVLMSSELRWSDLACGILESGSFGRATDRSGQGGPYVRKTSQVLRNLMNATGHGRHLLHDEDVQGFMALATSLLQGLSKADGSLGDQQFLLFLDKGKARLRPFGSFGSFAPTDLELPDGSLWVARGDVLQPAAAFSDDAIAELELLMNTAAAEGSYQQFFEEHPEFLVLLGPWRRAHSQLILHRDDGGPLIPDFFVERLDSNFCDIVDLKRSSVELVRRQRNRVRFRDAVMGAVAQLNQYREWFTERSHREDFRRRYGLDGYQPRVVIVIGRRESYFDEVERVRLESSLPPWVSLKTFDDVLAAAHRWRSLAAGP